VLAAAEYNDCGLMFLLFTVVAGATCVLASPAAFVQRPRLWLELVSEFKATCTPVPSFALPLRAREDDRARELAEPHPRERADIQVIGL
jgi:acyl-CoA synthetase (AMP-forming)/AMP-acid ligase II